MVDFLRFHHANSGTTWGIRVELQQRVLPHGKMTLKLGTLESRCMRGVNPNPYQDCSVFGLKGRCSCLSQAGGSWSC